MLSGSHRPARNRHRLVERAADHASLPVLDGEGLRQYLLVGLDGVGPADLGGQTIPLTDKTFYTSAKVPYGVGVQLHCKPL